jgi:hypothetical protein
MGIRGMLTRFSAGKAEGKGTQRRTRRRYNNNNKMDFEESGWGVVDRIKFAGGKDQRRDIVNAGYRKCWEIRRVAG